MRHTGPGLIRCPHCEKDVPIAEWKCNPPHGIGNLAFTFWNWPPLDSTDWRISIPDLVRQLTGHRIIYTYGLLAFEHLHRFTGRKTVFSKASAQNRQWARGGPLLVRAVREKGDVTWTRRR